MASGLPRAPRTGTARSTPIPPGCEQLPRSGIRGDQMAAGGSAALQMGDAERTAHALRQILGSLDRDARNFGIAARSEAELDLALRPIEASGYTILADRKWPGGTRSQVDFVVVGPAGVFIVDAKDWRDVAVADLGDGPRVFQGQDDVTDRFDNLARLAAECRRDLADVGLAPGEVHALAVFTNRSDLRSSVRGVEILSLKDAARYITGRHDRLDSAQVRLVLEAVDLHFPPYLIRESAVAIHPALDLPAAPDEDDVALFSTDEINDIVVRGVMREPIESWMSFLHPEQARLITRSFNGPSRIRGAAGTGKTVVGLHRAAHLARTLPGKILVTTYVKTLPEVLSSLLARLAPEIVHKVEFVNVHAFALRTLRAANVRVPLKAELIDQAFNLSWVRAGKRSSLVKFDPKAGPGYWKDEIASVIKGRGLRTLDEYQACSRAGRTRRLTPLNRADVWRLFEAYEAELARMQIWDFEDVVNNASALIGTVHGSTYSAVIIDEAQDLSCSMVRMLHKLVGDAPDAFNLIGDGQQSIYPGGYTLTELGISITGRGSVMSRNYRNTAEIASYASSIVAGDEFADIEGVPLTIDSAEFTRHGTQPRVIQYASADEHDRRLVMWIRDLLASGESLGDIAVLALYSRQVQSLTRTLAAARLPHISLSDYSGRPVDAIKVGTVKRAKGLEFKQVLLAHAPRSLLLPAGSDANRADSDGADELTRRELYVAMTRARDGLWVGVA